MSAVSPVKPAFEVDAFSAAMLDAVGQAQVGFHFEEGGCWGMAAALHEQLTAAGVVCSLRYEPEGFVHAWVDLAGTGFDYQGKLIRPRVGVAIGSITELKAIAQRYGVAEDEFFADMSWAQAVVTDAWERLQQLYAA